MPAKSEAQRKAAGVALAAKRGEIPASKLRGPAKQMAEMSEKQLRDFARKRKPHGSAPYTVLELKRGYRVRG